MSLQSLVSFAYSVALAQAEAPAGEGAQPNPLTSMIPMLVAFAAIFYFFMIRPQQKRERERQDMLASLSKGDKVVTNGGILGTIVGLSEKSVVVRVSDDPPVKIEFLRAAISKAARDDEK